MALEALSAIDSSEKTIHSTQESTYWNGREVNLPDSDFRLARLGKLQVHTMLFHETNPRVVLCAREVSVKTSEPKTSDKDSTREQKSAPEPKQPEPKHSISTKGTVSRDNKGREKEKVGVNYKYSHKNDDGSSVDIQIEGNASRERYRSEERPNDILSGDVTASTTWHF